MDKWDKLKEQCPNLYRKIHPCGCSDGWFDIIKEGSLKIEKLLEEISEEHRESMYATTIKEKYGTLSFYMSSATDEIFDIVEGMEDASVDVCEGCGKPGKIVLGGWLKTQCKPCRKIYHEKMKKRMENLNAGRNKKDS